MKILIKFSILFLNDKNKGSAIPYLAHVQHLLCNSKNSKKIWVFYFIAMFITFISFTKYQTSWQKYHPIKTVVLWFFQVLNFLDWEIDFRNNALTLEMYSKPVNTRSKRLWWKNHKKNFPSSNSKKLIYLHFPLVCFF